jgi:hypothetical protein
LLIPRKRVYNIIPTKYIKNKDGFTVVRAPIAVSIRVKTKFVSTLWMNALSSKILEYDQKLIEPS